MSRRKGFTLIELLVVIAIIALLLSIMVPALKSAKRLAQGAVCLANESQLIKSYILYADDYDSYIVDGDVSYNVGDMAGYVTNTNRPSGPSTVMVHTWVGRPMGANRQASNESIQDKIRGFEAGGLWPYIEAPKLYNCPADKRSRSEVSSSVGLGGYRTYSIGKPLSKRSDWAGTGEFESEISKMSEFVSPGNKIVFLEETERQAGWNDRGWNLDMNPSSPIWIDPVAVLHNNSSTFAFADGHADKHKWVNEMTIEMAEAGEKDRSALGIDGLPTEDYLWMKKTYIPGRIPTVLK